jgi:hypothetical protein
VVGVAEAGAPAQADNSATPAASSSHSITVLTQNR